MGDDVYEPFEINDFDLDNAFNPLKRRRGTKHQQLYGVFADEEDEDGDDDSGHRGRKKDYTAPMSFVSGGVKKGDKVEAAVDGAQEDDGSPIEVSYPKRKQRPFSKKGKNFDDATSFAGIRNSAAAGTSGSQGSWEKHTKGIGAKLLSKMGYVPGKGLGKAGQGIVEPVQAALRPGRGAVGAYGPEGTGPKIDKREEFQRKPTGRTTGVDSDEGEEEEKRGNRWRKDGTAKAAKTKVRYRTWEEVVSEGGTLKKQLAGEHKTVKVIDMTGKEKKVFTGYDVFRYRTREPGSDEEDADEPSTGLVRAFDLPELRQNLDLLVEMTEEEIVRNDRQLKFLKDQKVALLNDEKTLTETIEMDEKQMDRLSAVLTILNEFEGRCANRLSLDDCKDLFQRLQRDYYEEYKMYGLSSIAATNVLPLLKEHFVRWNPLVDPGFGYDLMEEWKSIFEEDSSNYVSGIGGGSKLENMHPYHRLLWEAWMPVIRRCALEWNPKTQCDEMVNLMNQWSPILPGWILENVLEQIILPRLQREVESWNPMTDTTPIHFWLHPWLPFMGDRLQPVYGPIRHKLGRALVQWHPSDPSAKNVLKPWKEVFAMGAMQSFLSQHILPKLDSSVAELQVNPSDQDLRPWHWLMDWLDMINPAMIADILVRHFFPKWHHTLISWLNCRTANYNEISQWYSGWKSLIHSDLMAFQMIKDQFTHALEVMNQAISGGSLPPTAVPYAPPSRVVDQAAAERQRVAAEIHQKHMDILTSRTGPTATVNFKDLVERKAEENGLLFMPIPNKFREGKPVYRFGSCQIYVDRHVVFLLQPTSNQWIPVSLEQLVTSARS